MIEKSSMLASLLTSALKDKSTTQISNFSAELPATCAFICAKGMDIKNQK